jgi:hypothetical protein
VVSVSTRLRRAANTTEHHPDAAFGPGYLLDLGAHVHDGVIRGWWQRKREDGLWARTGRAGRSVLRRNWSGPVGRLWEAR